MNAKEYRLGNLINSNEIDINNGTKVNIPVEVDMGILFELQRGNICNRYNPIPLTEEWLLKFGFIKNPLHSNIFYSEFATPSMIFRLYWPTETEKRCVLHCKIDQHFYPELLYLGTVHQLQNLYFALTSEELTIK